MKNIVKDAILLLIFLSFILFSGGCGGSSSDGVASDESGDDEGVQSGNFTMSGPAYEISGGVAYITDGGEYTAAGSLTEGMILISAPGESVHLKLNGVSIANSSKPAILVLEAGSAIVELVDASDNSVADGGGDTDYDAAIFSLAPLTIRGNGTLTVHGNNQEGIASDSTLTIDGGDIRIIAADDGLNSGGDLTINDGYLYIESIGDGIDSNANLSINGGTVISLGGMSGGDGGIDADVGYLLSINGGTIIATGQDIPTPDSGSAQRSMLLNFEQQSSGTLVYIERVSNSTTSGELTFKPAKEYRAFFYSSPNLESAATYNVYLGGSCNGIEVDGLYLSGSYTPGTQQSNNGSTNFVIAGTAGVFNVGGNQSGDRPTGSATPPQMP